MKNHVSYLLPAAVWTFAFLCALYPINALDLEFFTVCILTLLGWGFVYLAHGLKTGWVIPKSNVLLFSGLFSLLVFASLFWSEIKPVTLLSACLFAVMPITFFIGAVFPDKNVFRTIGYAMVPLFFVMGIWAVIQYFYLHDYFAGQARHPLADPSSLGALFSLVFFCAIGWMILGVTKFQKAVAFALAVVLVAGITATVARGAIFAAIPGLIVLAICLWPMVKQSKKSLLALLVMMIVIPMVMQTLGGPKQKLVSRVVDTVSLSSNDISNHRVDLWTSTIDMIKDRPLLGTGFGTYYMYLPEYKHQNYTSAAYHAHNDPLELWSDLGVLGPVLFYLFVIAAAWRTIAALRKIRPEQRTEKIVIATIFSALLAMVVHTHVTFNLYNISILMLTGFLLSVWFYATRLVLDDKTIVARMPDNMPPIINLAVLSLPFMMIGFLFLSNVAGEYYTNKARDDMFKHKMDNFAANINKAGQISNRTNYRSYLLAVNVPLTLLEVGKNTLNVAEKRELYEQAAGYMKEVLAINPRSDAAYYYQAKAQELAGKDAIPEGEKTREELYKEALRLNPMHLGARLALYKMYKEEKRSNEELLAIMEPAVDMYFNTPVAGEYYKQMAMLYLETGNSIKASEVMYKMAIFQKRSTISEIMQGMTVPEALLRFDPLER